jgi:hypothetical protein
MQFVAKLFPYMKDKLYTGQNITQEESLQNIEGRKGLTFPQHQHQGYV